MRKETAMKNPVYTIGYQDKTLARLQDALEDRGIRFLVDVRSRPYGRRTEFNRRALETAFDRSPIHYMWAGKRLGGFSEITDAAINDLARFVAGNVVCIMCMEADFHKCHRYYEIARRLWERHGIPAQHI